MSKKNENNFAFFIRKPNVYTNYRGQGSTWDILNNFVSRRALTPVIIIPFVSAI